MPQQAREFGQFANQLGSQIINNRRAQLQAEIQRRKNEEIAGISDDFISVVNDPSADERGINTRRAITQARILKSRYMTQPEKLQASNTIDSLAMARIGQRTQKPQERLLGYEDIKTPRGGTRRIARFGQDEKNITRLQELNLGDDFAPQTPRGTDDPNIRRKYVEDISRARNQIGAWDGQIKLAQNELASIPTVDAMGNANPEVGQKRSEIRQMMMKKVEAEALLGSAEDSARNAGISVDYSGRMRKGNTTVPRRNRFQQTSEVTEPNIGYALPSSENVTPLRSEYVTREPEVKQAESGFQEFNVGGKKYRVPSDKVVAFKKAKGLQ